MENDAPLDVSRIALQEVAQRVGVSTATVSRVLNGRGSVAMETRMRVLNCVRELGYVVPRLVRNRSGLIGLTSVKMSGSYHAVVVEGATEGAHAHNARVVVCPLPRRHNCGMTLLERLVQEFTDGAIIIGSTEDAEELAAVHNSGYPLVVVDPSFPVPQEMCTVTMATLAAGRAVGEHLLALGHRRIATITASAEWIQTQELRTGLQLAFQAAGLSAPAELEFVAPNANSGRPLGKKAFEHFFSLPEPPTAIFTFDDAIAVGVLHAAYEHGLRVPEDLSLVSFGDTEIIEGTWPPLTSVRLPLAEMGLVAVDLLYRLIERKMKGQELVGKCVELSTQLMVRASTGPLL